LFVFFPKLESHLWLFPKRRAIHRQLDRFLGMIDSIIEEKRRKIQTGDNQNESLEENEKDLLTLMLESERKGEGKMTNEELQVIHIHVYSSSYSHSYQSNLCVFFVAGHDTTANALSFALYHLAVHPEIQQRARDEVIRILSDEKQDITPTVEDTKQMNYINQIIKEVLRINCPVNNTQIRYAAEDCELAGTFVPKGTHLMVNIFDTQHCEKYWPNPLEFDPDRFNTDGTQNASQNMTWIPFGNGARQCIGMNFSLAEQRVILSMLCK
jgi:cholesterol 24(S)-hydroxylase